jgi:hypothetical protein
MFPIVTTLGSTSPSGVIGWLGFLSVEPQRILGVKIKREVISVVS